MTEVIKKIKEKKFIENMEPGVWWDKFNIKVKKECITYCRNKAKNHSHEKRALEREMERLQGNIDGNIDIKNNTENLVNTKMR